MVATALNADQVIVQSLGLYLEEIERIMDADCLAYFGPIGFNADDRIRVAVEGIEKKKKRLVVILQTEGGFAETARRISDTFRHHYQVVDFLIPSHAHSAGTILALSGDSIHMDYYSVLGPIDPQIEGPDRKLVPALGYLIKYEELLKKAKKGKISNVELDILLSFDQGMLYAYEQARDLSTSLLQEWLCKYKFKDWDFTETRKMPVTTAYKKKRAKEISEKLNDVKLWNSHGIGINIRQAREIVGLKIDDFSDNKELDAAVKQFHTLLTDYMGKKVLMAVVETSHSFEALS